MAKNDKKLLSGVGQRLKQLVPSKLKKHDEEMHPDLTLHLRKQEAALGKKEKPQSSKQATNKKTKKQHAGKRWKR
jgi:hypothetical protein